MASGEEPVLAAGPDHDGGEEMAGEGNMPFDDAGCAEGGADAVVAPAAWSEGGGRELPAGAGARGAELGDAGTEATAAGRELGAEPELGGEGSELGGEGSELGGEGSELGGEGTELKETARAHSADGRWPNSSWHAALQK